MFKKKPKSEYAEAVTVLLSYTNFSITNEGQRVIENHEKTGDYSYMFTGAFIFMNGICNQLSDEVGDGGADPMTMFKSLEITAASTAFLQALMEGQQENGLMNDKEVGFLIDLQQELITQPALKFQGMLEIGKLAIPKK